MKPAGIAPSKVEYDLGKNSVGQPVTLTNEGGKWLLKRHPADQRDDSYGMYLTVEQMELLGQIAEGRRTMT